MIPMHQFALVVAGSSVLSAAVFVACSTGGPTRARTDVAPPITDISTTAYDAASRVHLDKVPPHEEPGLHNVYRLSEDIISGSEPHGEEAFKHLQEMGVKTILSVDGKAPDLQLAQKYGMTYVHVPIQYKGIADEEMLEIAKTFREKQGPFFVHCFHGKHRGPAAAAVGRLVLDGASREQAIAEMRQWCGTSEKYEGLYRTIADADIPDAACTSAFEWDFPSVHPLRGFRSAMIEVSRAEDNLKSVSKHGWQADAEHPDVDALNEASKLASIFERGVTLDDVVSKPEDFRGWMSASAAATAELRDAIKKWRTDSSATPVTAIDEAYKRVTGLCNDCHKAYRD